MRPTRLGPGTRQPETTEGLRANDGANLIAINVQVAHVRMINHVLNTTINARVQAKRQTVTTSIDATYQLRQPIIIKGCHMQHRAEYLARQVIDAVNPHHTRRNEVALVRHRHLLDQPPLLLGLGQIGNHVSLCIGINHRTHIGGQIPRVANGQGIHRAVQHLKQRLLDIPLHVQKP